MSMPISRIQCKRDFLHFGLSVEIYNSPAKTDKATAIVAVIRAAAPAEEGQMPVKFELADGTYVALGWASGRRTSP